MSRLLAQFSLFVSLSVSVGGAALSRLCFLHQVPPSGLRPAGRVRHAPSCGSTRLVCAVHLKLVAGVNTFRITSRCSLCLNSATPVPWPHSLEAPSAGVPGATPACR